MSSSIHTSRFWKTCIFPQWRDDEPDFILQGALFGGKYLSSSFREYLELSRGGEPQAKGQNVALLSSLSF